MRTTALLLVLLVAGHASARPALCDDIDEAADEVTTSSTALIECVRRSEYVEDCGRKAREVREAAEAFETLIAEAASEFEDDASEVCGQPVRPWWHQP